MTDDGGGGGGNVDDEGYHVQWVWLSMAESRYKPQLHQVEPSELTATVA